MEFYERVSGARMHAAYHRPHQTFNFDLDENLLNDMLFFIKNCYTTLNEMHNMLTYNKIWKQRLINVGTYGIKECKNYGLTGVMARCTGIKRDLRLSHAETYSHYDLFEFKSFTTENGDSYDRFLLRMFEMSESLHIANQASNKLLQVGGLKKFTKYAKTTVLGKNKDFSVLKSYEYMEDLIEHFIGWHDGISIENDYVNVYIESPKGEFGVSLLSDNTAHPYRCKIKSPSYQNLQFLPKLTKGHFLADLATLIGTIDIVFGEVDR